MGKQKTSEAASSKKNSMLEDASLYLFLEHNSTQDKKKFLILVVRGAGFDLWAWES